MINKLFTGSTINRSNYSKIKYNREYLLSNDTAKELNTYLNFGPFATFNDLFQEEYNSNNKINKNSKNGPGALGVRSLFNKSGAVVLGSNDDKNYINHASEWRISNNVPLIDSPDNRKRIRENSACSVKELVKASREGLLGKSTYDFSDFMYCKYLGKVSNNYMITLRRFPLPVDDYISSVGVESRTLDGIYSQNSQSIGCMISWLGTSGNEMSNILKYSYSMPFVEKSAEWQDSGIDADSQSSPLNAIASVFDPVYRKQYQEGVTGGAINSYMEKYFKAGANKYNAKNLYDFKDNNKVYGPVDAIKKTYMRSDEGLEFNQDITLVFEYELRSYNGINGRQAMLDLLSNILNVTYTTGTFWGGGYRGGGAHQNNIFANMNIFKANGGFSSYMDAITKDWSTIKSELAGKVQNPGESIKSFLNEGLGMILGGLLNKFGRPEKQMVSSLLSPAPIGFWHVTIGNPHHPIMSMGNMILTNTIIEHYGPLGLDDFPTGLKVTCELKRGKPRDIRDIERIYMHGNDRIYTSMGPKIFDMYKHAQEYKGNKLSIKGNSDTEVKITGDNIVINTPKELNNVLKKYFGHDDAYSIYVAAAEQEYGAQKPSTKKGTSSGDSGVAGTGGFTGNTNYLQ